MSGKLIVCLLLPALLLTVTSCATISEKNPHTLYNGSTASDAKYTYETTAFSLLGTIIGGLSGYFIVQSNKNTTTSTLATVFGAAVGGVIGWYAGKTVTDELRKNDSPDDTKLKEYMKQYRWIKERELEKGK
jgi:outer membrane lipoprotein SlyB